MKCRQHNHESGAGVCASCLREHLLALVAARGDHSPPGSLSLSPSPSPSPPPLPLQQPQPLPPALSLVGLPLSLLPPIRCQRVRGLRSAPPFLRQPRGRAFIICRPAVRLRQVLHPLNSVRPPPEVRGGDHARSTSSEIPAIDPLVPGAH
uniref:Uncharacterized protein n=1 Tax=Musa acuminata subsp. malaccensis TaxID=214687 RepID=A0A804L2J6_MUSAM